MQLPEGREADTRARVQRLHPGARETPPLGRHPGCARRHRRGAGRRPCRPVAAAARHGRRAGVPPARLRRRPNHPAGRDAVVRRDRRPPRLTRPVACRGPGAGPESLSRSSCPAIGCLPPAVAWAASRPAAGSRRSCACWRSKAGRPPPRRRSSMETARSTSTGRGGGARALGPGDGAAHRRGRAVCDGAEDDAEPVCRVGRVDRLPAAHRQGRGDHLRARAARCSHAPITGRRRADPARQRRAAARRRPLERQAARAARPGAAKRERGIADAGRRSQQIGRRDGDRAAHAKCAASAAGRSRCC